MRASSRGQSAVGSTLNRQKPLRQRYPKFGNRFRVLHSAHFIEVELMALLNKLFGPSPQKKDVASPQQSIDRLRQTLEMLEKREAYLESKVLKEVQTAKANATKNKRAAIMALKRKKAYETQINNLGGARLTIETQIMAIEGATTNVAALQAMQEGARTMKQMNKNMEVEDVEDVMEDIREQMEVATEVGQAISTPLGVDDADEADLEEELERLLDADLKEQFKDVSLPAAPQQPVKAPAGKAPAKTEDDEFAALSAEMGIS